MLIYHTTRQYRMVVSEAMTRSRAAWRDLFWYGSWVAPLLVYLLFPNREFTIDALIYAGQIESIRNLFALPNYLQNPFAASPPYFSVLLETWHPHHLIFNPFGFLLLQILRPFGITQILYPLAAVNSFASALGCGFFYLLLKCVGLDRRIALATAWLLAFSFGWWFYAITLETYAIPLLLMVWALYLIFRHDHQQEGRMALIAPLILMTGLAVLFHQSYVFTVPIVGFLLLVRGRVHIHHAIVYLIGTGLFVATIYLAAAAATGHLSSPAFP